MRKLRYTTETFIEKAREIHDNKYDYSLVKYDGILARLKIICPEHGVFEQRATNHLSGYGCRECVKRSPGNIEKIKSKSNSKELDFSESVYVNNKTPIKVICKKCGTIFYPRPDNLLFYKTGCPVCTKRSGISRKENELKEFIKSLGLKFRENSRKIIPPYEIDIFIPSLNIAVEYNGLYWHSKEVLEKRLEDYKNYHLNKLEKCEEKGIRLIQIFEDEWINNKEEIKEKIKTIIQGKEVFSNKEIIDKRWGAGILLKKMGYKLLESSSPKLWYIKNNKRYEKKVSENTIYDCGVEVWAYSN